MNFELFNITISIWLLLFVIWGLPLTYYRSKFRKIVYRTDSWVINLKPVFFDELRGLFGNLYPDNSDYLKMRNFYRMYLSVYTIPIHFIFYLQLIIMFKIIKQSEKVIIISLIAMMTLMLLIATINLAFNVFQKFIEAPNYLITTDGLMHIFDSFLIVLIGLELLETIRTYLKDNVVHVEVVMLVALIAIARKVIILDYEKYSGIMIMGIGVLIVALSVGYYFIRRAIYKYHDAGSSNVITKNINEKIE
jgi:uncharacterized membrane protein (DUF373 family)